MAFAIASGARPEHGFEGLLRVNLLEVLPQLHMPTTTMSLLSLLLLLQRRVNRANWLT